MTQRWLVRLGAGVAAATLGTMAGLAPVGGLAPAAVGQPAGLELATAIARPALVAVEVRWHGWVRDTRTGEVFGGVEGYQVTGWCTGFAVHADGHLVTAGQCVDRGPHGAGNLMFDQVVGELAAADRAVDVDQARAELADNAVVEGDAEDAPPVREVLVHRGVVLDGETIDDPLPAEVVDVVPPDEGDVALLDVARGRLSALALSDAGPPSEGTQVAAVGYPAPDGADGAGDPARPPEVADGPVGEARPAGGVAFVGVDAEVAAGMRGGPVVDESGAVIGLLSSGPEGGAPQTLVAPATAVREALVGNDVPYGPGPIDDNFRAGVERQLAGEDADAVVYFDAVLEASPTHLAASERKREAERASSGLGRGGGGPLVPTAILFAVVAVAAGVAAAIVFLLRTGERG